MITLGSYKNNNPKDYEELKRICGQRGIKVDDSTPISEILEKNKSVEANFKRICAEMDNQRRGLK